MIAHSVLSVKRPRGRQRPRPAHVA